MGVCVGEGEEEEEGGGGGGGGGGESSRQPDSAITKFQLIPPPK